jgi:hypothetical protein
LTVVHGTCTTAVALSQLAVVNRTCTTTVALSLLTVVQKGWRNRAALAPSWSKRQHREGTGRQNIHDQRDRYILCAQEM